MNPFIARHPVDLLALVPYALGFHPEESAVLLTFGDAVRGTSVGGSFHVRVDLPAGSAERDEVVATLTDVVLGHRCEQVGLVLYSDDAMTALAFHEALVPRLLDAGVGVIDSLRVGDGRFHSAADPGDPGEAYELDSHPFTLALAHEGRVAHTSRQALADTLVGGEEHDRDRIAAAAGRFADRLLETGAAGPSGVAALVGEVRRQARWLQERIRAHEAARETAWETVPLSAEDAGRMLVLVSLGVVQEVALGELTRARARTQLELWRDLTRRAPSDLLAGAASLCAFAAWVNGEGALAWCALERCLAEAPDDPLARYVISLLESATPPTAWEPVPQSALRALSGGVDPDPVPGAGGVAS